MPLEWLSTPPASAIFILLVSMLMTFASSLVNRLFTSKGQRERLRALKHRIDELKKNMDEDRKKARSTSDKKLLKKVRKQEKQLLQLQSQMASLSLRQMRVLPLTMAMFLIVWMFLTGRLLYWSLLPGLFTGGEPVAYLPWISGEIPLNLFLWYIICSFLFGTIFSRLFGLTGGD